MTLKFNIAEINSVTRQLNNQLLANKTKTTLRTKRKNLMKQVISNKSFSKNEKYFLLPKVQPDIYISYNTAVVGNSVNLCKNQYGKEIDAHADIVRFNYAPTKNYEKYCGKKNTIRVCSYIALTGKKPTNHPKINNMVYNLDEILENNKIIVFYKKKFQLKTVNKHKHNFTKKKNTIHTILWDPKFFNDILVFNKIDRLKKHPQCGTGMMLLLTDLNITPNVYGIDTKFSQDNFFYYWDDTNKKCEQLSSFHNYNDEFRVPTKLKNLKLIKLH